MKATITFEDHGQDFLEWDIENSVVVGCRPFQGLIWCGNKVLNKRLSPGDKVIIRPEGGVMEIKYPLIKVEPLKPAAVKKRREKAAFA
jgi:hypothetical protein